MDKNRYMILPTSENLNKPRFMEFLDSVLDHMVALGTAGESIESAFDVQNAAGAQLDIIGELVGLSRMLPYLPATGSRTMDDDEYRLALLLKIAQNEWDGTNGGAVEAVRKYLSGDINVSFVDSQDSNVHYSIVGAISTRQAEILNANGLLLVPTGVNSTVSFDLGNVEVTAYVGTCVTGMAMSTNVKMI